MPPPFRRITLDEFGSLLAQFPFQRQVTSVHMHHTWRPNHGQYRGHASIVSMWRAHTVDNGWSDIAQHLTIAPDGALWLGRDWNRSPASAGGHNGTAAAGPFMFEMIGDFDAGKDPFAGAQKDAALRVVALVQEHFALPVSSLRFHNQMSPKSCPGGALSYEATLREVAALRGDAGRESVFAEGLPVSGEAGFVLGDEDAGGAGATGGEVVLGDDAAPLAPDRRPVADAGDGGDDDRTDELVLALLRDSPGGVGDDPADAEPGEREGPGERGDDRRARAASANEGVFGGGEEIPVEVIEALRPHIINLKRGRFSNAGRSRTTPADVDAIFGEDLERAVAGRTPGDPLRIVVWAHGGLIDEVSGLQIAHKHLRWWQANGVYPLYFVWETGLNAALGRLLKGRSGGEEAVTTEGVLDLTDKAVESLAWALRARDIWSDMKQSARLAIDPQEGGAAYAADKLAAFCARHPGVVELHAVGHSAGSIFHASFLPDAHARKVPPFKTLALLAPAIRADRFNERLAPHLGAGKAIEQLSMFTMNRLRELDDTCMGAYRKSLLYLIFHALEDKRKTPILGLEDSLRSDPALQALFGLGDSPPLPGVEAIWSNSPASAGPRRRTQSTSHGGFDDDPATMDSVLRRILDRDVIALSYGQAAAGEAATGGGFIAGDESVAEAVAVEQPEEVYGVDFDVLDAFERAAELGADEASGLETLGAVAAPTIDFGPNARSADVTAFSLQVLGEIMRAAGCSRVQISSTSRDPANQARVMFGNCEKFGVEHQKRLYGPSGDQVIEVYRRAKASGRGPEAIKAAMAAEIVRIGPTRVSRHASDPKVLNVFDVAPSSVAAKAAFIRAVKADRRVAKFLEPPADPGFHLEIPQPRISA